MDNRNFIIFFLFAIVTLLSITLIIGAYAVTHAPSPYELRGDADAAFTELRQRVTANQTDQHTSDVDVINQIVDIQDHLDQIDQEIERLALAQHLTPHHYHHRK